MIRKTVADGLRRIVCPRIRERGDRRGNMREWEIGYNERAIPLAYSSHPALKETTHCTVQRTPHRTEHRAIEHRTPPCTRSRTPTRWTPKRQTPNREDQNITQQNAKTNSREHRYQSQHNTTDSTPILERPYQLQITLRH